MLSPFKSRGFKDWTITECVKVLEIMTSWEEDSHRRLSEQLILVLCSLRKIYRLVSRHFHKSVTYSCLFFLLFQVKTTMPHNNYSVQRKNHDPTRTTTSTGTRTTSVSTGPFVRKSDSVVVIDFKGRKGSGFLGVVK